MSTPEWDERDAQDMARLAGGQGAALNDLMERHAEKLFHYLTRCLQNEGDAADLAQETFVRVYQHRGRYDRRQKFSTWLYTIATNLVRDRFRWRSRHPEVSLDAEDGEDGGSLKEGLASEAELPDARTLAEERAEAVRKAVETLPEELKQPLILSIYQELPQAEIASVLCCSVKAVETRIYRARQQLKARLGALVGEG